MNVIAAFGGLDLNAGIMNAAEYRQALDALPYGKRLPGAVYLLDPGDEPGIPSLLRITVAELRKRVDIGSAFNLLNKPRSVQKANFYQFRPQGMCCLPTGLWQFRLSF